MLRSLLSALAPPLCVACSGHAGRAEPLCPRCRAALPWLGAEPIALAGLEVWAPVAYDGAARSLVRALKFRGALRLADTMAAHLAANAPPGLLEGALVPVPLHRWRRRRRGFNQSELLARALAARTGLTVSDCLERARPTASQVGRGLGARFAAMEGAVDARGSPPVPRRAVLVDDVATTGATLASCAAALRRGGAREVVAVVYARTLAR